MYPKWKASLKANELEIVLRDDNNNYLTLYIDVYDTPLAQKWLGAVNHLLENNHHLEKNYCFHGFVTSKRTCQYILNQVNNTISAINASTLDYKINDHFTLENTVDENGRLIQSKLNDLHRYFEDLQGVSNNMSRHYTEADSAIRWHIRQLNLLCHEYESIVRAIRQLSFNPRNYRPSQLMCWLNAPRFELTPEDCDSFGIETLARSFGGVYVGVNKAIGKTHWEVFLDEGGKPLDDLTTTVLRPQSEAAGDFDIEWGSRVGLDPIQQQQFTDFTNWLIDNGFDPNDKSLTIGHPKVAQVDLIKSFGAFDGKSIRKILGRHLDVYKIETSTQSQTYNYKWSDPDYQEQQTRILNDNT
jgi:hypothetical protein